MKYYIAQGQQSTGPYDINQLRAMAISPETLVWNNTMPQWTPAGQVDELRRELFADASPKQQPPYSQPYNQPYNQQGYQQPYMGNPGTMPPCPPSYLWFSILTTLLCMPILGIIAIIYSTKVQSRYNRGDYPRALSASKTALILNFVALALGLVGSCLLTFSGLSYLSMLNSAL